MLFNKIVLPLFYLVCWIIVYLLPRKLFHISGIGGWLIFIIFIFLLPFCLYKILLRNGLKKENSKGFAYFSIFFIIPFMLFVEKEDKIELKKYRKETIGVINKASMRSRRKSSKIWKVNAIFKVKNKKYQTSSKDDKDKILSIGDTVLIIYSSKTPEINEIKELTDYYKN